MLHRTTSQPPPGTPQSGRERPRLDTAGPPPAEVPAFDSAAPANRHGQRLHQAQLEVEKRGAAAAAPGPALGAPCTLGPFRRPSGPAPGGFRQTATSRFAVRRAPQDEHLADRRQAENLDVLTCGSLRGRGLPAPAAARSPPRPHSRRRRPGRCCRAARQQRGRVSAAGLRHQLGAARSRFRGGRAVGRRPAGRPASAGRRHGHAVWGWPAGRQGRLRRTPISRFCIWRDQPAGQLAGRRCAKTFDVLTCRSLRGQVRLQLVHASDFVCFLSAGRSWLRVARPVLPMLSCAASFPAALPRTPLCYVCHVCTGHPKFAPKFLYLRPFSINSLRREDRTCCYGRIWKRIRGGLVKDFPCPAVFCIHAASL